MTRRRFFASWNSFNFDSNAVTLTSDEARHLRDVLRLKSGDEVHVFDGAGREFRCRVSQVARNSAELAIEQEVEPSRPESPLKLTLVLALLKGEKFDLVVQKATELGVNCVVPLITRYADVHLRDESESVKRVTRWQRIALEAAKQSGRAVVPEITLPVSFQNFLSARNAAALRLMFSEREGGSLNEVAGTPVKPKNLIAMIGSEGGWSDEELTYARSAGFFIVTLGGRTMRAETAAIAATSLVQYVFGDLN
jgi:16S rRNA (uracil1498-N3)-methyltransferase